MRFGSAGQSRDFGYTYASQTVVDHSPSPAETLETDIRHLLTFTPFASGDDFGFLAGGLPASNSTAA